MKYDFRKPSKRSAFRKFLGRSYYSVRRYLHWFRQRTWYQYRFTKENLPYCIFTHRTPLFRQLKDVEQYLQENKVQNLKLAIARLDGLVLSSQKALSYWKVIGNPTERKGYLPGMILEDGEFKAGIGGGLCQLSNLLFWMTLHTPLTVVERWRHGYDVFPDAVRTQPFGSGATCYFPFLDLVLLNKTPCQFQLRLRMEEGYLVGEWRSDQTSPERYRIEERDHAIESLPWGGYVRSNRLVRIIESSQGVREEEIARNRAKMMYEPLLEERN